jgi:class 3 adenylate cyclase
MRCPQCGHENSVEMKFCGDCGARLGSGASSRQLPSPDTYTPKHLAERILTSKAALEGERKQVTILFADLKGSMELLADRDPEEARKLLDPVVERMMEAVHHYEGTVNQVMGDGIMALFGAAAGAGSRPAGSAGAEILSFPRGEMAGVGGGPLRPVMQHSSARR